jgi:hypothetical protein
MYIRCPKCGRRGYLPDRLVPEANSLRCRRCKANFLTPELAGLSADRGGGPAFDAAGGVGLTDRPTAFVADGYFSGFDDEPGPPRERGPGDSNYELTFTLRDISADSSTEWDTAAATVEPEPPSSDEIAAVSPAARVYRPSDSWHVHFIESWGRVFIGAAVGLIAVSIPFIVYVLSREDGVGTSPTLVAGFACTVGLLMISIPMMLLTTCLAELVRDVRRLREHLERKG